MRWHKNSKTKNKLETLLFALFFLIFSSSFFSATESILLLKTSDSVIDEYQGHFEVSRIKYYRNTVYLFVLNNGDKISVPAEDVSEKDFSTFDKYVFKYTRSVNFRGRHKGLSISSLDGLELLDEKSIRNDLKISIIPFYLMALLFFSFALLFLCLGYGDKIYKSVKNQRRKKKRRNTGER